jgi:hypothetical protein
MPSAIKQRHWLWHLVMMLTVVVLGLPAATSAQVTLTVQQFGLANMARPGSWIGVQVQVADTSPTTRDVILELSLLDPDGDTALYQTVVPLGGETRSTWLYARLPHTARSTSTFRITASAASELTDEERSLGLARSGARLGETKFQPQRFMTPVTGLIGVVGRSAAGMEAFSLPADTTADFAPLAHQRYEVVTGLTAASLPDRWMGLSAYEYLLWTGTGPDQEPTDLREDQAFAIQQWVQRGGQLIVVLPQVGQNWASPTQPLRPILPAVTIERVEGAPIAPLAPLISNRRVQLPQTGLLQYLKPNFTSGPEAVYPILNGPNGLPLVVRRHVGAGSVTLIGMDVTNRGLNAMGAVQPDIFWHRILGRRGQMLTAQELSSPSLARQQQLTNRGPRQIDVDIPSLINKTGKAALGVLLAFGLFALFWTVAGPLGYFILKKRNLTHHAWVFFMVATALFTGIAWGAASFLRPRSSDALHLTFLTHVFGQPVQSARSFTSVLLPEYGRMVLGVGDPSAEPPTSTSGSHNTIAPYDAPNLGNVDRSVPAFPNAQAYAVQSRMPMNLRVPSRGTIKSVVTEWMGPPVWKLPVPVAEPNLPEGVQQPTDGQLNTPTLALRSFDPPIRIEGGQSRIFEVIGGLRHELPTSLRNVHVIVVKEQLDIRRGQSYTGQLYARAFVRQLAEWEPGIVLDVDDLSMGWRSMDGQLLRDLRGTVADDDFGFNQQAAARRTTDTMINERLLAISLYGVLDPPRLNVDTRQPLVQRADTHGLDLSKWFTQPCVIVIGTIDGSHSMIPLTVDSQPPASAGRTVVRWVFPLPARPPIIAPDDAPEPAANQPVPPAANP